MYAVSEEYRKAMHGRVQTFRLTGTAGEKPFTDANILKGSFSVTNQCSGSTAVEIGQVYIGELTATFLDMGISRYQWQGLEIRPSLGLKLADGSFEDVPLGVFTVSEAEWTASGTVVKAYDNMSRFEKNYSGGNAKGKPYDLLANACEHCGVTLGMTQAEVEALPNGGETLSVYTTENIDTWRDFLAWLSQAMGCFATIDRAGALVFRRYTQEPVDTLDTEHRFSGAAFSDYTTRYTGLSCVDLELQKTVYLSVPPDDGLTYNLGSNPFLQRGGGDVMARRRAVLEALLPIQYVPFRVTAIGNPAYDLGDCIRFTDGLADGSLSCITKYSFIYNQKYEMQGAGEDPSLASAKSKSDKDISGLLAAINETAIQFYFFVSVVDVLVEDKRSRMVVDLDYTAREDANVVFHGEIKYTVETTKPKPEPEPEPEPGTDSNHSTATDTQEDTPDEDAKPKEATIIVTYYVQGVEVTEYHPVDLAGDGTRLLHLMYFWNVPEDTLDGDFQVWIRMEGGQMTIKSGEARGYLMGQGLAAEMEKKLRYIFIATLPEKRDYIEGQYADYTGLVIMALYADGETEDITALCEIDPYDSSLLETVGEIPVVATYTDEDGNMYRDGFSITVVEKTLERIEITIPPYQTEYVTGEAFNYEGLVVTAFYDNETQEEVTELCEIDPPAGELAGDAGPVPVTVSFTKGEVTKEATFEMEVLVIDRIEVTVYPTKQEYYPGETMDYSGLVVTAYYENGKEEDVTAECTLSPAPGSVPEVEEDLPVMVHFQRGSVEKETEISLYVIPLESIEITKESDLTEFTEGDRISYPGLEVTAHFGDGTTKVVTQDCVFNPAPGSNAVLGTDTVTITYTPSAASSASTSFGITVKVKPKKKVKAIQFMPTTYEESLARIKGVMGMNSKILQRIEQKRQSVFGGRSDNLVVSAGYCNYKGSGSTRYTLSDISPWVGTGKYLYQFTDPATGVSQGTRLPSGNTLYTEFYPHQYMWENCSGNSFFFIVATEGEIQQDEALSTPWCSDLCMGFGSDVFDYDPFPTSGRQPYQAYAANYIIVEVDDPNDN